MVLKSRDQLPPVAVPDPVWLPPARRKKRYTPADLAGRVWRFLRSTRGQQFLAWVIVLAFIVVDGVLVGQHVLVRYQSYHADAFDLGNMDQAVWNTLHGHLFRFTNRGEDWFGPPTRLGVHVEPILLLIAPLYLLHSGPETLLLLQAVGLALGGIPLFLLGLRRLPELPLVAAAFVGAYLATPEILGEALYDFHAVTLATPLLLLALWALDARRYRWFVVAAVLAAFCKEEVALSLVPLGLLLAFHQRKPRLGVAVSLLAAGWTALCFLVILPHFNTGGNNFWYRYSWLGSSPVSAIHHVLAQPSLPFSVLQNPDKRDYLAVLLRTGGGLGVFAPMLWLSALPDFAINILSSHEQQYDAFFQYNAVLLPYLLAGAIVGTSTLITYVRKKPFFSLCFTSSRRLTAKRSPNPGKPLRPGGNGRVKRARRQSSYWFGMAIIGWLIVSSWWNLTATQAVIQGFWAAGDHPDPQQAQIDSLLARIPPSASVAATDTLNPHLSDRYTLYLMPDPQSYSADYVAVDIVDAAAANQQADELMYETMLASGKYRIIGGVGNVMLLQRVGGKNT